MVNRSGNVDGLSANGRCDQEIRISHPVSAPAATQGLDASGFSLVSWNIQKENRSGWESDFKRLSRNADLFILQEAYLTEKLKRLLNRRPYYWYLITAFEYQDVKAGVLTAATIEPDFICPLRAVEPLIRVPKTIIITRYPLSNTPHALMIANVHMINFAPHQTAYIDQAQRMEEILADHPGPMILSGDFNTWSAQRLAIIADMAARLKLEAVDFRTDLIRTVFGYAVDRVYFRGLTLEEARVVEVTSSDHNPLLVRFRLDRDG
jgi:endonuclease/exonuclease/phosphatase (EEP) superfamily protein YafD